MKTGAGPVSIDHGYHRNLIRQKLDEFAHQIESLKHCTLFRNLGEGNGSQKYNLRDWKQVLRDSARYLLRDGDFGQIAQRVK